MDQKKVDAFAERLLNEVNAAVSCLNLYLGHRLGLYQAMADAGSVTPAELAGRTGYTERYLREWLECMAVGGYLDHEAATGRFSLPPEHAVAFLDHDNPAYVAPFFCWIPSFAGILAPLMEAFRSGGGVPFEAYGSDTLEAIGMGNRPMFVNDYAAKWIPAMPDIETRLQASGRVAEIGCGVGWSSISLAQGFPNVHIDAIDMDAASIKQAQRNAQQADVADRIVFHLASAEELPLKGPYDLVTAFEVIHDMAYPVKALRRMHELAGPNGAVLIADEAVGENLEENCNFLGRLMYNFSVLHCLPQAMVFPGAAGTGTIMRPSTLRDYAQEAGFTRVDVLPIENLFWRFYRLTP
ncbi:MAG: class I SAM-dependent methyltransferase [Anaerolineales bacterium]